MIEDHWDTRQEYIKQGNELAALEQKQEKEKKEQEKALKEMKEKMNTVPTQVSNVRSSGGELMPTYVPPKQEVNPTSQNVPNGIPTQAMPQPNSKELDSMRALENRGRMGFQNNMQSTMVQRPFGQNRNPMQGNGGHF